MHHLPTPILVIALLLIDFGSLISLMNWVCCYASWKSNRFHSAIPIFGAAFLALGLFTLPVTRRWTWLALIVDYGTLVLLISLPYIIKQEWGYCRFTRIATYVGSRGPVTVTLNLNRNALMVLKFDIKLRAGEFGLAGSGNTGTWSKRDNRLQVLAGDLLAEFETIGGEDGSDPEGEKLRCVSASGATVGKRDDTNLDGFVLTRQLGAAPAKMG